ncbi:MAG: STAS domain-containing protein [Gammaproteobacteria bacterium]|nr:STAS domain-containing protein [Gammaproteobacteria bacterium]
MRVEEIQSGSTLVMVVSGRVDLSTVAEFETRLAGWTRPGTLSAMVLDMTDLTYVASRGLRAMLQATRALARRSGRFMLCAPAGHVRALLNMTGFDQVLEIHDTRAAALSSLEHPADNED